MKQTTHNSPPKTKRGIGLKESLVMTGIGITALGVASCTTPDLSGAGGAVDAISKYGSGYLPSEARQAVDVIRTLKAIAEYQASEKQLASARSKAKRSSSSERQYIRVKPDTKSQSSGSSTEGTHVVAYEPSTGKLDDEVVVVRDTNLSKGDSVSINGQSGKII